LRSKQTSKRVSQGGTVCEANRENPIGESEARYPQAGEFRRNGRNLRSRGVEGGATSEERSDETRRNDEAFMSAASKMFERSE
jgi:hypothetical protein